MLGLKVLRQLCIIWARFMAVITLCSFMGTVLGPKIFCKKTDITSQ